MISALLLRTNIAKVQKLYFTLSPTAASAGFYKPSVILISPRGGSGHLLPGGGQVSPRFEGRWCLSCHLRRTGDLFRALCTAGSAEGASGLPCGRFITGWVGLCECSGAT